MVVAIPKRCVERALEKHGERVILDRLAILFLLGGPPYCYDDENLWEARRLQGVLEDKEKLGPIQREKLKDLLVCGLCLDKNLGD